MYKNDSLIHFGILGQKWGVRRFQNEDGTLTAEGKKRYLGEENFLLGGKVYSEKAGDIFNKAQKRVTEEAGDIEEEFNQKEKFGFFNEQDEVDANLDYLKKMRSLYQEIYRDEIAKDIGTDPSTLDGQDWLKDVLYYDYFDAPIAELEKKSDDLFFNRKKD